MESMPTMRTVLFPVRDALSLSRYRDVPATVLRVRARHQATQAVNTSDDDIGRDLAAFLEEHRACGTLDTGLTGDPERVWMACSCGARIEQPVVA
jgi:hypothetical protein